MLRTHFSTATGAACGRVVRTVLTDTRRVTCVPCRKTPEFEAARATQDAEREAAFQAQEPREFTEPWRIGLITCECGSTLFRDRGRTCYRHYDNYVCSACGKTQSRLTETGMSF